MSNNKKGLDMAINPYVENRLTWTHEIIIFIQSNYINQSKEWVPKARLSKINPFGKIKIRV